MATMTQEQFYAKFPEKLASAPEFIRRKLTAQPEVLFEESAKQTVVLPHQQKLAPKSDCPRCQGHGFPQYLHIANGHCLKCDAPPSVEAERQYMLTQAYHQSHNHLMVEEVAETLSKIDEGEHVCMAHTRELRQTKTGQRAALLCTCGKFIKWDRLTPEEKGLPF